MTPFQEELFRLIQDCKKEATAFTSSEEDSGNEVNKIIKFSQKWDYKERYEKIIDEAKALNEKVERELKGATNTITKNLYKELTPIIDELFIASKMVEADSPIEKGIKIILNNLEKLLLRKDGCIIKPSIGEELNPIKHKAIAAEEVSGHIGNTISEVYRYGYSILGQVIREAEVKVKCGTK